MRSNFAFAFFTLLMIFVAPSTLLAEKTHGSAPDFTLVDVTGKRLKLSGLQGDVVMINFWASWCAPCRQEMPLLDSLSKRYKNLGFTLLGVNIEEDSEKAKGVLKTIPVTFPILFDTKNEVSKLYNLVAMPSSVLVDRTGKIRFVHAGYVPGDEQKYDKWIRELVRE